MDAIEWLSSSPPPVIFANDLAALRAQYGNPSYSDIALRIRRNREAEGMSTVSAQISKSTVHSQFSLTRKRYNAELIGEIVLAITHDESESQKWLRRAATLAISAADVENIGDGIAEDAATEASQPETVELMQTVTATDESPPTSLAVNPQRAPEHQISAIQAVCNGSMQSTQTTALPLTAQVTNAIVIDTPFAKRIPKSLVIVLCIALNFFAPMLIEVIYRGYPPIFVDMIGTAISALALGPWYGVAVGVVSNLASTTLGGAGITHLLFAIVQIVGALIWGYGTRKFRWFATFPRFVLLSAIVGLASAIISVPILISQVGHLGFPAGQALAEAIIGHSTLSIGIAFLVNTSINIIDKVLTSILAYPTAKWLSENTSAKS